MGVSSLCIPLTEREARDVRRAATLAQTSVAGVVRDALRRAGFRVQARRGDPKPGAEAPADMLREDRDVAGATLPTRRCARCGRTGRFKVVRLGGADWCEACARRRYTVRRDKNGVVADAGIVGATPGF